MLFYALPDDVSVTRMQEHICIEYLLSNFKILLSKSWSHIWKWYISFTWYIRYICFYIWNLLPLPNRLDVQLKFTWHVTSQTVVGTDIADLLLEGHEPTTLEYKSSGVKISTSQSQSLENLTEVGEDETEKTLTVAADRSLVNRRKSLTMEEVTDRFRHLLLYGRKKVRS